MLNFNSIIQKARTSAFYLWLLNIVSARTIPFNKPHQLRITSLTQHSINVTGKYTRFNKNHLNGIHACLLATLCEYCTGFLLITNFDSSQYRLILKTLKMDYVYQAKSNVYAVFEINDEYINTIKTELKTNGVTETTCEIKIVDEAKNHICTGYITWQIKEWSKVKTKV
jgi:acyl-coenzyme A thioesterase PaaI-like protein